jgi:hypothetical protein
VFSLAHNYYGGGLQRWLAWDDAQKGGGGLAGFHLLSGSFRRIAAKSNRSIPPDTGGPRL